MFLLRDNRALSKESPCRSYFCSLEVFFSATWQATAALRWQKGVACKSVKVYTAGTR